MSPWRALVGCRHSSNGNRIRAGWKHDIQIGPAVLSKASLIWPRCTPDSAEKLWKSCSGHEEGHTLGGYCGVLGGTRGGEIGRASRRSGKKASAVLNLEGRGRKCQWDYQRPSASIIRGWRRCCGQAEGWKWVGLLCEHPCMRQAMHEVLSLGGLYASPEALALSHGRHRQAAAPRSAKAAGSARY